MKRIGFAFFGLLICAVALFATGQPETKKTSIDFWHHESPTHRVAAFQQVIDAFKAQNPNIDVTQHVVSWDDSITKIVAALAAGNPPDMMFTYPSHTVNLYRTGGLTSVDSLVADLDKKYSYIPGETDQFKYQGHYWGVPVFTMIYALSYRPSFFQKYVGTTDPPETWDQFLDYAKKTTTDTPDGKIYGIGLGAGKNLFGAQQVYTLLINSGGMVFDKNGKVIFDSPETVRALQFYKDLMQYAPPGTTAWAWGEQEMAFASGKTAMMMSNGIPDARRFAEMGNSDIAAAPQPYLAGGKRGSISFVNGVAVFKKAQDRGNMDAVSKFISFMMVPEQNATLCNMEPFSFLPVTKATMEHSGYWEHPMIKPLESSGRAIMDSLQYGTLWGIENGGWTNLAIGAIESSGIIADVAQKVAVGELTPAQAAKWGQSEMEKIVATAQ